MSGVRRSVEGELHVKFVRGKPIARTVADVAGSRNDGCAHTAHSNGEFSAALLRRNAEVVHGSRAERLLRGRRVLVTGAAGSIGSDLARQASELGAEVYLLDHDESRLH